MSDINVRSLSFSNQGLEVIWTKAFDTYSPSNSNQVHKHKATVWYGISWPEAVDIHTHHDGGRDGFYIANPANAIIHKDVLGSLSSAGFWGTQANMCGA